MYDELRSAPAITDIPTAMTRPSDAPLLHGSQSTPAGEPARPPDAALTAAERGNNPYTGRWARTYDLLLSLPPVGQIRRSEERVLHELMARTLRPDDRVLEVGPGTGHYTVALARRCAHVTAVEQSPQMVELLQRRIAREGIHNCRVLVGDFARTSLEGDYDVVVLIGVLDYIPEPEPFLCRAAEHARRELLFTAPHCGLLAKAFRLSNRLRKVHICNFDPDRLRACLSDFEVEITETGLRTRLWRGMTLACRAVRL